MKRLPAVAIRLAAAGAIALLALTTTSRSQSDLAGESELGTHVLLRVLDADSGEPIAARFSVTVDGEPHEPRWVGPHGIRFPSVHLSKRQVRIVTYARGTGPVRISLPPGARQVTVEAAKGLDYLSASAGGVVEGASLDLTLRLRRWNRLGAEGWHPADAHLHYDRIDSGGDRDWIAMMAGDGIDHAQFMVLKGGMVPGVWAEQFGYGKAGETRAGPRTIVAGEEYRDLLQGHLLLFGVQEVIQPIMTGVSGSPHNYPLFPDVLDRARELGALTGAAHGGTLGSRPTVLLDAILGKLDFMEIANWVTGFWPLDNWYRLLNAGFILPATAGSDLPNNPQREPWQPFLGGMRMYARTNGATGSEPWNEALSRGETFVTNGPSIEIDAGGAGPGGTVCLPNSGGAVRVRIRLQAPRELARAELVVDGRVVAAADQARIEGGVHEINLETSQDFRQSGWLAARGTGSDQTIPRGTEVAHTSAIRVIVGSQPIRSADAVAELLAMLASQRAYYLENGRYASAEHGRQMARLFDRAIGDLTSGVARFADTAVDACEAP